MLRRIGLLCIFSAALLYAPFVLAQPQEPEFLPQQPAAAATDIPDAAPDVPLGTGPESTDGLEPVTPPKPEAPDAKQYTPMGIARLQALDKITARVSNLDVTVGETAQFGTLDITVQSCQVAVDEEAPENAAFLVIDELQPREDVKQLFTGWMFASSPALSAVEHPVYDVWLMGCKNPDTKASGKAP